MWNADVELPVMTETGLGLIGYTTYLQVPLGNPPYASIDFVRGYVTLQAMLGRRSFRFRDPRSAIRAPTLVLSDQEGRGPGVIQEVPLVAAQRSGNPP